MTPVKSISIPSYENSTQQLTLWEKQPGLKKQKIAVFRGSTLIVLDPFIKTILEDHLKARAFIFNPLEPFEGRCRVVFSDSQAPLALLRINDEFLKKYQEGVYTFEAEPIES
jgi:hypothetical protein